jgi:DNA-binding response OmpR family regulator
VLWTFKKDGVDVRAADCGVQGLAVASARTFDLLLIDLCLPDMLGTEFVRRLQRTSHVPFVLISGFLRTEATVEAMKLGAANVLEKPITIETLRAAVYSSLEERVSAPSADPSGGMQSDSALSLGVRPRSAAERWARFVIKACQSDRDLTTVGEWAAYLGVSRSSLGESCELIGIRPRASRDLMRLLRVLAQDREPETELLVNDRRTLARLLERGGLTGSRSVSRSVDRFLANQTFVRADNEGLRALRGLLGLMT